MKLYLRILSIAVLFLCPILSMSHESGHTVPARIWRYQDKSTAAEGHLLRVRNDRAVIFNHRSKVISLALRDLSWIDKQYVERQLDKIANINTVRVVPPTEMLPSLLTETVSSLAAVLMFSFLLIRFIIQAPFKAKRGAAVGFLLLFFVGFACKKEIAAVVTNIKTDPEIINTAFVPYKASVTTRWDANYFYVESNGIPAHNMMIGITNWQQQVPVPQPYTSANAWSIPLTPQLATNPLSTKTNFMTGAIAIAANGVPIFNPLNNRGEDSYLIGELDQWGGHCGKADDYHYHLPPLHLQTTGGNLPIAYALDGFAVYGTKEADGSAMLPLDEYHGHIGPNGVYHYHGTTAYPYMIGAMRGIVSLDPATSAPENRILPQASPKPLRPSMTPLPGAKIINFTAPAKNAYSLEYQTNLKSGFIHYSWDNADKYTFVFIDTNGKTTTQTYQK